MQLGDTIVAISTPPGRGGLGVVRLSGQQSLPIARAILRLTDDLLPRMATLADLLDSEEQAVDNVVATYFAAPRSYTAEDVVEISCHGSPVVLRHCVERALSRGARPAEPGEFTLRAYMNGRIDLPRAEAVRDLINATTLYQARVASQQMHGALSRRLAPLKEQMLELIALLEAGIDFAEDDVSVASGDEILGRIAPLRTGLEKLARTFEYGKLVNEGFSLAIVGKPNVGKSSLFNRLLERDRAIVTDIPGTTRDTVSETASLGGLPVKFIDTAGIRESQDVVETLGIERSREAMTDADMVLAVVDGSQPLDAEDHKMLAEAITGKRHLIVANKADRGRLDNRQGALAVSALTGEGIDDLRDAILRSIVPAGETAPEPGFITSLRHEQLLRETVEALDHARDAVNFGIPHEMLLLDLYAALRPLDAITGATTADDILHRIFSTFCIGK